MPFSERAELDISDSTGNVIRARAYASDCKLSINNESSDSAADGGVFTSLVVTVNLQTHIKCDGNYEEEMISDAFIPGVENECEYRACDYTEFITDISEKRKIDFSIPRDENADGSDVWVLAIDVSHAHRAVLSRRNQGEQRGRRGESASSWI